MHPGASPRSRKVPGAGARKLAFLLAATLLPAAAAAQDPNPPVFSILKIARRFSGYTGRLEEVALSSDGRRALTGDSRHNVVLWDAARGAAVRVLTGHTAIVFSLAFSPDGRTALSGSGDGTIRWWDLESGRTLREIDAGGKQVFSVAFSSDGRRALSGDESGGAKIWRLSDGRLLRDLGQHLAPVISAGFAAEGKVVTTDFDNRVRILDARTGKPVSSFRLTGWKPAVKGFISADRRSFLAIGESVQLRDASSGALLKSFPQGSVTGDLGTRVAFSPDGKYVLVESARQLLNLWETGSGRLVRTFIPANHARGFAFTPDDRTLIGVFGGARTLLSWPVAPPPEKAEGAVAQAAKPASSPSTAVAAALGRLLFFDPRLSKDGSVSCATCHDPKEGWTDRRPVAVGVGNARGLRRTQTLLNVSLHNPLFWDGRANDLEDQVHFPIDNPREMAFSMAAATREVSGIEGYRPYFAAAFGDGGVTPRRIAVSIASFERTLVALDSPYDRYAAGDVHALTAQERRGLQLFRSKGRCFVCHELEPSVHQMFLDIGLPQPAGKRDLGRYNVTKAELDRRAFQVPDLHDLAYTAPYMHDGSLATLEAVVDFYDRGGGPDPNKSPWMLPLHLTPSEKTDLVAFLKSMSGNPLAQNAPKTLPR